MAGSRPPGEPGDAWRSYTTSADHLLAEAAQASTSQQYSCFRGLDSLCRSGRVHAAAQHLKAAAEAALLGGPLQCCWQAVGLDPLSGKEPLPEQELAALELRLAHALQTYAGAVASHAALLAAFCGQAWRALKLSGLPPVPLLHSMRPDFETFAAVALLTAAGDGFPGLLQSYYGWKLQQYRQSLRPLLGRRHAACFQDSDEDEVADSDAESADVPVRVNPDPEVAAEDAAAEMQAAAGALSNALSDSERFGAMHAIAEALRQLRLQDVSGGACEAVVAAAVRAAVDRLTRGRLTQAVLPTVQAFVRAVILPFLTMLLGERAAIGGETVGFVAPPAVGRWERRLATYTFDAVGRLRIAELFEIVKLYPETAPAVRDLGACLRRCRLQRELARAFGAACAARLHIPGAKTSDIIDVYVATIKILRELDPSGGLLAAVGGPTRAYLQGRKDTIRCIVTAMTDDRSEVGGERLYDELQQPAAEDEDDEEREDDAFALLQLRTWEPQPDGGGLPGQPGPRGPGDIISMLVQIYGSKDLFINEYRGMLAERLLARTGFDTEGEVRTLELLKQRFGEANLHDCEVMMKDMADSKRLFNTIRAMPDSVRSPVRGKRLGRNRGIGPVAATIISALFWPQLQEEPLTLPEQMEEHLDEYAAKFWVAKQPRKLAWRRHLGTVELALSVAGVQREFAVPPFEAALLMLFQRRATWTAGELATELGSSAGATSRRAAFWVKQGVLEEGPGESYTRVTSLAGAGGGADGAGPMAVDEEEGAGSALLSQEDQAAKEMAMYEQYVLGMLTNFEAGLPAERIHNMLKMFVPDQAYDRSATQLAAFLAQLVTDEKLSVSGGVFTRRLP